MELCAAVTGIYLGWTVLALYPRRVVRLSFRLLQDLALLLALSFLLLLVCSEVLACSILAVVAYVMYHDLPAPQMAVAERAVLITGCDSGLGHALAIKLDAKGFQVFAGCLFPDGEGCQQLVSQASSRLVAVPMDVTSQEQVEEAAQTVASKLKGKVLHGVVNNAGILMTANPEVMSLADIRKIMEVNYFGMINVYRAFMPLLRKPRRGTARLVNVSSNIGLAPASQYCAYGASKAAVALLNETLRYELKPLGLDVVTIVPSGFRTGILAFDKEAAAKRWWNAASEDVREYFGHGCFHLEQKVKDYKKYLNPDFSAITDCMLDALISTHPRPIYYKGLLARSLPFLYLHLPSPMWDKVMPMLADYYEFPVQALQQRDKDR